MPPRVPKWSPLKGTLWLVTAAGTVLVPLIIDPKGLDSFRLPKEVAFLLVTITLIALLGIAAVLGHLRREDSPPYWQLYVVILGWVGMCTIASDQPLLSIRSLLMTAGGLALAAVVSSVGKTKSLRTVGLILIPAVINGALFAVEALGIWHPFVTKRQFDDFMAVSGRDPSAEIHSINNALIGNSSDVAGFFLAPAIALCALTLVLRGSSKLAALAGAIILIALVAETRNLTALIAVVAGVATMAACAARSGKTRLATMLAILGGSIAILLSGPVRAKIIQNLTDLKQQRYDRILTGRMPPLVAALEMAREHKILGVGPGCFPYRYVDYKLKAEETRPWLLNSVGGEVNFGEAHSDHLQVAAELGIPGYFLFLVSLGIIGAGSFQRVGIQPDDARRRFSEIISLPLAVCFGIFAAMQFPLRLPAVFVGFIFLSALSVSWGRANPNS